tara:strand:- start:1481 stop:1864 length:384 start_codon:yes stop_codon:yes gene_type:complete
MNEGEYDFEKFTSDSSDDYPKYADGITEGKEQTKDVIAEIREDAKRSIERLKEAIVLANEEARLVDGHDDALTGYDSKGRAVYLVERIIETLIDRDGMTHEEAIEWFDHNIECAFVGKYTPLYIYKE